MRILWVEDEIEENTDISVTKVFRSLDLDLHEVVQIRSFDEAYEIINDLHITLQLENIDFVVLDIDLSKSVPGEHTRKLTKQFEPKDDFLIKAGFDLFIFVFMGLIPRLLRRELNLVLPSFSQKHPKYPVACCGDFLFS